MKLILVGRFLVLVIIISHIPENQGILSLEASEVSSSEQLHGNGTSSLIGAQTVGFPSHNPQDIHFYAFPSLRNCTAGDEIILNNVTSLQKSTLNPSLKLKIFIHGFASSYLDHFPALILKTYLNTSLEYNYIAVDWSLLAYSPTYLYPAVYADVVKWNIPTVAKRVADFINFLVVSNYTRLDMIHIIGHSLGAHVSGWAGKLIQEKAASSAVEICTDEDENKPEMRLLNNSLVNVTSTISNKNKIARISGLDPAGPLFDGIEVQRKLRPDDAVFVDVYHTAIGTRGDSKVSGHVDFYPNGGYVQPPCKVEDYMFPLFIGSCSHKFVANIYAATITKNITACPCGDFEKGLVPLPKCTAPSTASVSLEPCSNETLVGERLPSS